MRIDGRRLHFHARVQTVFVPAAGGGADEWQLPSAADRSFHPLIGAASPAPQ